VDHDEPWTAEHARALVGELGGTSFRVRRPVDGVVIDEVEEVLHVEEHALEGDELEG
jgi:hypothetical protein